MSKRPSLLYCWINGSRIDLKHQNLTSRDFATLVATFSSTFKSFNSHSGSNVTKHTFYILEIS